MHRCATVCGPGRQRIATRAYEHGDAFVPQCSFGAQSSFEAHASQPQLQVPAVGLGCSMHSVPWCAHGLGGIV